jgi:phosphate transport system permease protein
VISSKLIDKIVAKVFFACAVSSIIIVVLIFFYVFSGGFSTLIDWVTTGFGMDWNGNPPNKMFGIIPGMFYTFYVGIGATAFAAVIGIPCAIYLAEYANLKFRNVIKPSLEVLTSLPSVVVGLVGAVLVVGSIKGIFNVSNGSGVFAAWIVLFIMCLPLIASISEDAICAVPSEQKEASLALGATKWQTTLKVSLPGAKSGILAAVVLAMGSAIGETMAVWMVMGGTPGQSPAPSLTYVFGTSEIIPTIIARGLNGENGVTPMGPLLAAGAMLFVIVGLLNIAIRQISKGEQATTGWNK